MVSSLSIFPNTVARAPCPAYCLNLTGLVVLGLVKVSLTIFKNGRSNSQNITNVNIIYLIAIIETS